MTREGKQEVIYRHSGPVRITHWVNVVALLVLLMSGLQIFNAHPALYFGSKSNFDDPAMAMRPMKHGEELVGVTTIAGWNIDTTNLFGLAYDKDGDYEIRGFPWSVTLPGHRDLSTKGLRPRTHSAAILPRSRTPAIPPRSPGLLAGGNRRAPSISSRRAASCCSWWCISPWC
jgi:hypothetical protein